MRIKDISPLAEICWNYGGGGANLFFVDIFLNCYNTVFHIFGRLWLVLGELNLTTYG